MSKIIINIAITAINLYLTYRGVKLIRKGEIKPALAMWSFFTIAVAMSLTTYISSGEGTYIDNVLNTTDLIYVCAMTIATLKYGDSSTKFKAFDLLCLGLVLLITAYWFISKQHFITNLAIQLILVIAYFPVFHRLFKTKVNTESFSLWLIMLVVSSLAVINSEGQLAFIYSMRAVISILVLLSVMKFIQLRYNTNSQ